LERIESSLWRRAVLAFSRTGASDLSASMVLVLGLGFAQNLLLARVLGPAGMGHMAVIYSVMGIASLLGTAGLTSSILRYGAAAPGDASAWQVYRTGARVSGGVSIAVAGLVIAFSRSRLWVFDPDAGAWMAFVVWTLPVQALGACSVHFLQARGAMREKALVDFFARLATVIGVVSGAVARGYEGAVVGYMAGSIVGGLLAIWRALTLRAPTHEPAWISTRELLRFGAWGLLTNALGLGLVTADLFCVSALVKDAAQTGIYSLAGQIQQVVGIPTRAYLDARFPEMTRLSEDPGALQRLWHRMRWHLAGVSAIGGLALGVVAPFALPIVFGHAFAASALPLSILLLGQVARSIGDAPGRSMFAAGWVVANFWLSLFSAIVTIAANLLLIPHFGIAGAALGTALANAMWAAAATLVCNHLHGTKRAAR